MADEDPNEMVRIRHEGIDAVGGPVTRASVELIHRHKGWTIIDAEEADGLAGDASLAALLEVPVGTVTARRLGSDGSLQSLTVAQLRERAASAGVSVSSSATKAELVAALSGSDA